MATKRYKLTFEVTGTKRNLLDLTTTITATPFSIKKGFLEVKVFKDGEEKSIILDDEQPFELKFLETLLETDTSKWEKFVSPPPIKPEEL